LLAARGCVVVSDRLFKSPWEREAKYMAKGKDAINLYA
jgi:hypothetical protein